jgi:hypothetical protein
MSYRASTPHSEIQVYKSKFHYPRIPENARYYPPTIAKIYDKQWNSPSRPKVVAFDLDETIGSFADLYLIWKTIFTKELYTGTLQRMTIQKIFNDLLDLYPEFLRYGILHILAFIKTKIQRGESHRIYLYTNNQCDYSVETFAVCPNPTEWIEMIIVYLNVKLGVKETVFAKPICAFKINNQVVEPLRQTTNKTHRDFLKCSILPKTTEICFIDNTYYPKMCHDKVYYIQPPPYVHSLSRNDIIERFIQSSFHQQLTRRYDCPMGNSEIFQGFTESVGIRNSLKLSNAEYGSPFQHEMYTKLLYYIKEFFCMTTRIYQTRRRYGHLGKFTRKRLRRSLRNP